LTLVKPGSHAPLETVVSKGTIVAVIICTMIVIVGIVVAIISEAHLPTPQQRHDPVYDRPARDLRAG